MGLGNNWENEEAMTGNCSKELEAEPVENCPQHPTPDGTSIVSLFSPFSSQQSSPGQQAGVCGLRNLGNTCFMSAGVQCLVATPPLTQALLAPQHPQHDLTRDLSDLTRQIWSGQYSALQPTKFKNSLSKHYPQFNDYRQHDCQEFLALLLDGLHEQLNTASKKDLVSSMNIDKDQDNVKAVNEEECKEKSDSSSKGVVNGGQGDVWSSLEPCYYQPGTSSASGDTTRMQVNDRPALDDVPALNNSNTFQTVSPSKTIPDNNITDKNLNNTCKASSKCLLKASNIECSTCKGAGGLGTGVNQVSKVDNVGMVLNNTFCGLSHSLVENIPLSGDSLLRNPVSVTHFSSLDDIVKNAKTSNVNVLGAELAPQAANNAIRFDSEKYPRVDNIRKKEGFSYNALGWKRMPGGAPVNVGLDLKRVKLEDEDDKNTRPDPPSPRHFLEKNIRMECEMKERMSEGQSHWEKHLAANRSVVVTTFQGQFRSQVVCSVCQYVSITYEPFMYLSVPLPKALKKQMKVTYINKSSNPREVIIEMNKNDSIGIMKENTLKELRGKVDGTIILGEVLHHHIARLLDENNSVGSINDSTRSLYAFDVATLTGDEVANSDISQHKKDSEMDFCEDSQLEMVCNICFEDKDVNIKKHKGCTLLICDNCIKSSCTHYGETFKCPTCSYKLNPNYDLLSLKPPSQVKTRLVKVSVLYRVDGEQIQLFGHPNLVRLPNHSNSSWLTSALASISPYGSNFSLRIVDGQGLWCGRCMFSDHCRGCAVQGTVKLYPSDTLAVCFTTRPLDQPTDVETAPISLPSPSITIYDCINAFSQSEVLDENNPWFCPNCKKNQCATKTLTVWRYPDYLIIYLKRFVFHDRISTKLEERVEFPIKGLNLSSGLLYDLYACVCHVGGVSSGHYTTYTLHSETDVWHYFNDSFVIKQTPKEQDFSSAYILFYKKQTL